MKMKNKLYVSIGLFALALVGAVSVNAQTSLDLSMRTALYFTGAKADKIDRTNDKYVNKDGTMELKKSQATSCDGDYCEFNIGFVAFAEERARTAKCPPTRFLPSITARRWAMRFISPTKNKSKKAFTKSS